METLYDEHDRNLLILTYPSERNMIMEMLRRSRSAAAAKSSLLAIDHVVGKTRRGGKKAVQDNK